MLKKYVAIEIISDTNVGEDRVASIVPMLDNLERFVQSTGENDDIKYFLVAPRNSIIAKETTGGIGRSDGPGTLSILYPFFSSHISLPVKPGEHVWGFDDGDGEVFWLTRIHEPEYIEDTNYTHSDRQSNPTVQNVNEYEIEPDVEIDKAPGFPNGKDFNNRESDRLEDTLTLEELTEEGINPGAFSLTSLLSYEHVVTGSFNTGSIMYEPVPRLFKRPGDLTLQGSNNTAIIFGTERGYGIDIRPDSAKTNNVPENDQASVTGLSEGMGAIDIVVGRGRIHDGSEANLDSDPADTRPRVTKNTRDFFETSKNIGLDDSKASDGSARADLPEGDPDMVKDSSRIYMSMKTDPDTLFSLEYPELSTEDPPVPVDPTPDNAAIIAKSDQIRVIARKDEDNSINGSIRIIKEGDTDADRATIVMQPDGTIMIDGPKIIIGSGFQDTDGTNGSGSQVIIGRDATEPIVLGNVLLEKLVALETAFNNHIHNSGAGPTTMHHATGGGAGVQSAEFAALAPPPPEPGAEPGDQPPIPGRSILSKVGKTK